jgi:hypothetical protein
VFTTRFGTPIEPRDFTRSFDRRIGKAKVRRITVHGTRKSCGSLLAALDVHPRVAMQILRHSKTAITMEIYTEVVSSATREALRKLGDQAATKMTLATATAVDQRRTRPRFMVRSLPLCSRPLRMSLCAAMPRGNGRN